MVHGSKKAIKKSETAASRRRKALTARKARKSSFQTWRKDEEARQRTLKNRKSHSTRPIDMSAETVVR